MPVPFHREAWLPVNIEPDVEGRQAALGFNAGPRGVARSPARSEPGATFHYRRLTGGGRYITLFLLRSAVSRAQRSRQGNTRDLELRIRTTA